MVCDGLGIEMYGKKILLTHEPVDDEWCDVNIHGHLHGHSEVAVNEKCVLYAPELENYQPVLLEKLTHR